MAVIVELAPMAGITNAAYRRLCLEQMWAQGADGLFVCEMITSRGLVERDETTVKSRSRLNTPLTHPYPLQGGDERHYPNSNPEGDERHHPNSYQSRSKKQSILLISDC